MCAIYQQNMADQYLPYWIYLSDLRVFPPHWHEEYELIYNVDEPFDIGIGDEVVTLDTGDIYIVEPRIIHSFQPQIIGRRRLVIQFKPQYFGPMSNKCENSRLSEPHLKGGNNETFSKPLEEIIDEFDHKRKGYEYMILSNLYTFIGRMVRDLPSIQYTEEEIHGRKNKIDRLEKVFDFVKTNHIRHISLKMISEIAGYSTYHFTKFFKESTGMTFNQYLSNIRVMKACEELMTTDNTITEISMNVGFNSVKTFNRVFKQIKGCSPTEYRIAISEV